MQALHIYYHHSDPSLESLERRVVVLERELAAAISDKRQLENQIQSLRQPTDAAAASLAADSQPPSK